MYTAYKTRQLNLAIKTRRKKSRITDNG